jgi:hypothetical protein
MISGDAEPSLSATTRCRSLTLRQLPSLRGRLIVFLGGDWAGASSGAAALGGAELEQKRDDEDGKQASPPSAHRGECARLTARRPRPVQAVVGAGAGSQDLAGARR